MRTPKNDPRSFFIWGTKPFCGKSLRVDFEAHFSKGSERPSHGPKPQFLNGMGSPVQLLVSLILAQKPSEFGYPG